LKLAFIVNGFPTLSETFILNQITGLLDRGYEVDIYAVSSTGEWPVHADVERYNLLQRTFYVGSNGAVPESKVLRLFNGLGYAITKLPKQPKAIVNSLNVLKYGRDAVSLTILFQIKPFLDRGPYDVVHGQFGPNGIVALSLRDKGAFAGKIITTFRGYDVSSYIRAKGTHIYDELFRRGDLFLCVSERIRDKLIALGCPEYKTLVHRSGVDTRKFSFVAREPKSNSRVKLLTIARLVEKKGVQYGIQAVTKILKNHANVEYTIVGDGPLRGDLETLIAELQVGNNIKLIGWKSDEEVPELLAEADIFLAPSVTSGNGDEEGIPGAVREALARGVPVVSTQHSGIPELVQDGVSGFLVPERDVDALADKLEYLIKHQETCSQMGNAGRKYVEQHYDLETLNDRLAEIYEQAVRS